MEKGDTSCDKCAHHHSGSQSTWWLKMAVVVVVVIAVVALATAIAALVMQVKQEAAQDTAHWTNPPRDAAKEERDLQKVTIFYYITS